MGFPLEELASALDTRAGTWRQLELAWHTRSISPNHGKPVVGSEFDSPAWLASIMIWCTGEAELETVRLRDGRTVMKHYDLVGRADLEVLLDEFVALLTRDRIPDGAVVGRGPGAPA